MSSATIDTMTVQAGAGAVPAESGAAEQPTGSIVHARLDRAGQIAPIPLLVAATVIAALSGIHAERLQPAGYVVVGFAAVWSVVLVVAANGRRHTGPGTFIAMWLVQAAAAGFLVWVNPWFGIFAFSCNLTAEVMPARLIRPGCLITAFLMAASQTVGYPFGRDAAGWLLYLVVAAVDCALTVTLYEVMTRVQHQNGERGRMIEQLNETNTALSTALAENAGLHAQLVAQAREAGVLDERQRLAGEIHDTLAQGLIAIVRHLDAAQEQVGTTERLCHHLAQARSSAQSSLAEARRSVRALRPEQLEHARLPEALRTLADDWSERSAIPVHTETAGDVTPTSPEVDHALFRVAQEALSNIDKHAHAARVGVTLTYLDGVVLLDVRDDGVGWSGAARPGGFGLEGMRQRLAGVDGSLSIETAPGAGTALSASVPRGTSR